MFELVVADKAQSEDGFRFYGGRLLLGSDIEFLRCCADLWGPTQYRQQWLAAGKELVKEPASRSAFVTSVARGRNNFVWWVARRRGGTIVFHNQLLHLCSGRQRVAPQSAHRFVKPKVIKHGPYAQAVSEWRVSVKELRQWLRRAQ